MTGQVTWHGDVAWWHGTPGKWKICSSCKSLQMVFLFCITDSKLTKLINRLIKQIKEIKETGLDWLNPNNYRTQNDSNSKPWSFFNQWSRWIPDILIWSWCPHQFSRGGRNSTPSSMGQFDFDIFLIGLGPIIADLLWKSMSPLILADLATEPSTAANLDCGSR